MNLYPEWWDTFLGEVETYQKDKGRPTTGIHLINPDSLPPELRIKYKKFYSEFTYNYTKHSVETNSCSGIGNKTTIVLTTAAIVYIIKITFFS